MTSTPTSVDPNQPVIVVTGANGLVGSHVCAALAERGATVRAVVRTAGAAPTGAGIEERVGEFTDSAFAADVVTGAAAVVTTVHPMGSDREVQEEIGVRGTTTIAQAAAQAGVDRLVHVSTAAVYERSPQTGDVDESGVLVSDDDNEDAILDRVEKHGGKVLWRHHYWKEFNGFNGAFEDPWGTTVVLWTKGGQDPVLPKGYTNE